MECPRCRKEVPEPVLQRYGGVCPPCLAGFAGEGAGAPTELEVPTVQPGMRFHGFEIVRRLGQGGMGTVYEARQVGLERSVALKILSAKLAQDEQFAQRFAREAKAMASLNHPNIVQVFDFGKEDGRYFLAMEYVEGVSLRGLMAGNRLRPEEALRIVPQICEALEYAHGHGVVHRDIKPENILVGRDGRVKIADFGLAKMVMEEGGTLTRTSVAMGTPQYMAPEQYERMKDVDHRADIYSLGVVFYEMLTGEVPAGHFQPPSRKVDVDARLDGIVLKAMAREPEKRYQRAVEVRTDMELMASGRGVVNEVQPAPARTSKVAVWSLACWGIAVAALVAGAVGDAEGVRWIASLGKTGAILAFLASPILAIAALIRIHLSHGRLVGRAYAVTALAFLLLPCAAIAVLSYSTGMPVEEVSQRRSVPARRPLKLDLDDVVSDLKLTHGSLFADGQGWVVTREHSEIREIRAEWDRLLGRQTFTSDNYTGAWRGVLQTGGTIIIILEMNGGAGSGRSLKETAGPGSFRCLESDSFHALIRQTRDDEVTSEEARRVADLLRGKFKP
ncbi:MAG: serine/threonine protein kinase [Planctomycetes bacterium]|nr:serine/threonine protein kinase [Planctomycetota bacterium]